MLIVPVPSSVPSVSATAGEIATELVWSNLAPLPLTLIPLLLLIAPVPLRIIVPAVIEVAPV